MALELVNILPYNHPYRWDGRAFGDPLLWRPNQLGSALALWLDAEDTASITLNGATVSQWNDKSGNNKHAAQSTALNQPTYTASGINNKPSLNFNATNNNHLLTTLTLPHPVTIYSVAAAAAATGGVRAIIGSGSLSYALGILSSAPAVNAYALWNPGLNRGVYIDNVQTTNPVIVGATTVSDDESTWNTYFNGSNAGQIKQTTGIPNAPSDLIIGWSIGSEYWSGNIGEVVVLRSTATTNERQWIEGYLAWKWDLVASLPAGHPYKTTPPTVS